LATIILSALHWSTQINMNIHTKKICIPKLQSILSGQCFLWLWLRSLCSRWRHLSAYFLLLF
jgi:hypothetical protein